MNSQCDARCERHEDAGQHRVQTTVNRCRLTHGIVLADDNDTPARCRPIPTKGRAV